MRVLFLNQFYPPSLAPTGHLLADAARAVAAAGHEVRVLTGAGRYQDSEVGRPPGREVAGRLEVVRTWSPDLGKGRHWTRLADFAAYFAGVVVRAAGPWRPDRVVAMTSPPFLVAAALAYRLRCRAPIVLWSMDRFPAALVAFGLLGPDGAAHRALAALESSILANVETVIALDRDMAAALTAAGARRVEIVANWERADELPLDDAGARALRAASGLEDRFVVRYAGNLGHDHDVATLLDMAAALADRPEVVVVVTGGGSGRAALEAAVERRGLANVRTASFVGRSQRAALLRSADLHLVTLRPEVVSISTPSKTYGILASGRPLLYIGPAASEVARVVRAADCGRTVAPGDADAAAAFVRTLLDDPAAARAMGDRARRSFLTHYEHGPAMARLLPVLLGPN